MGEGSLAGRAIKGRDVVADRVRRELSRLEALAARRRMRVHILRGLRGSLGAAATLLGLLKLKLAGSLALKLGIALLVGVGFAWPLVALAALVVCGFVLSVLSLFVDGQVDCPEAACDCGCDRREKRAARLKQHIIERRAWLADPSGPAPSILGPPQDPVLQPLK